MIVDSVNKQWNVLLGFDQNLGVLDCYKNTGAKETLVVMNFINNLVFPESGMFAHVMFGEHQLFMCILQLHSPAGALDYPSVKGVW